MGRAIVITGIGSPGITPKPAEGSYELYVENFEHVPAGTTYASVDSEDLVADESFWPILTSVEGSEDILGYTGRKIGASLADVRETRIGENRGKGDGE